MASASTTTDASSGDGSYSFFGSTVGITSSQFGNVNRVAYSGGGQLTFNNVNTRVIPSAAGSGGKLFVHPIILDPNNDDFLYYPVSNRVWRQSQLTSLANFQWSGQTTGWTEMTGTAVSSRNITAINLGTASNTLYYGASSGSLAPQIFKLENANTAGASTNAVNITPNTSNWPSGGYVHNIAINPFNDNELIVVLSNYNIVGVYHTNDGGNSWTEIEGDLIGTSGLPGPSIRSAAIHNVGTERCYLVGTSTGLYATTTLSGASTTWTKMAPGLIGNAIVESLDSRDVDATLLVGTHGRGAFIGVAPVGNLDPPTLTSFAPDCEAIGNTVTLTGTNFAQVVSVEFNGTPATFSLNSSTEIEAVVPTGASTGQITVTTAAGTAISVDDFVVINTIFRNGAWTNGAPNITRIAKIEDDYFSNAEGNFSAQGIIVDNSGSLVIESGNVIFTQESLVNNGSIIVKEGGALVQTSEFPTNSGTGTFTVERAGSTHQGVTTYWSSPVQNATVNSIFASNVLGVETFNASTQSWGQAVSTSDPLSGVFGFRNTGNSTTSSTAITFNLSDNTGFNSGLYSYNLEFDGTADVADKNWNLIGNPYPSSVDVRQFLQANQSTIEPSVYVWGTSKDFAERGSADYATIGYAGVVNVENDGLSEDATSIRPGTSFFVQARESRNLQFTNAQRVRFDNDSQSSVNSWQRIWVGVEGSNGAKNEILVGFMPDALDGKDEYDARKLSGNDFVSFYSIGSGDFADEQLVIQGLPTLDRNRVVPLGINVKQATTFTFNMNNTIGFPTTTEIYLFDAETGVYTNLSAGDSYQATLTTGEINDRFSLRFIDLTSFSDELVDKGFFIYGAQSEIKVEFIRPTLAQAEIVVYDAAGKLLLDELNTNALDISIPIRVAGVYVIKVKNQNGTFVEKLYVRQ